MARPDPALLDPARYPARFTLATRFQDLDPNKHVNNTATAALFEDMRVRFNGQTGLHPALNAAHCRIMVASLTIDYLAELFYPDPVDGYVGVLEVGRSSWIEAGLLGQGGRITAVMRATLVCTLGGRPEPIPDALRALMDQHRLQPAAGA